MYKAVFLDRDGTINKEKHYLYRIDEFEYLHGAVEGMKLLADNGYLIVIITNQSGIARGYYKLEDYLKLDKWMKQDLLNREIEIAGTYFCPHLPDATVMKYKKRCNCRKPGIELFYTAAKDLEIDLEGSYAIGDRLRDCEIARKTGCHGILIEHTEDDNIIGLVQKGEYPNISYRENLFDAAIKICGES